jgi:hypothetical protein
MGLESASFIEDLVTTNPVATDAVSAGDDHLRMIKSTIKSTFPGFAGRCDRVQSKNAGYTALLNDNHSVLSCSGAITITLTAAATLGNGWFLVVYATDATVTIDPSGAELINGAATLAVPAGTLAFVWCTGSAFIGLLGSVAGLNQIIQGNTSVTVTDTGSDGAITLVQDGATTFVANSDGSVFYNGLLVNHRTNVTTAGNGIKIGTVSKASADEGGGGGTVSFASDDATNPLEGGMALVTSATASERRLKISALEQNVAWRNVTLCEEAGNVGIGTSSPSSDWKVTIAGDDSVWPGMTLRNSTAETAFYSTSSAGWCGTVSNHPFLIQTNYTERMRITAGGEVLVGGSTDNGAYNLQCNGTAVWGAGAYVNGSDERIKDDITPIVSGLDVVEKLNPVTYRYKESWTKDQSVQTGFIAQELLVALEDQVYVEGVVQQGGSEGYYSVAYQNLIPILTKAIQEQQAIIEALTARIEALENA